MSKQIGTINLNFPFYENYICFISIIIIDATNQKLKGVYVMNDFVNIFNSAMELICLGFYEKSEISGQRKGNDGFIYSPLLKKALDKFSLLTMTYSLFDNEGKPLLPADETSLIKAFNFPIKELIDQLPINFRQLLEKTEWYTEEAFVNIGKENCFYCTSDLLDRLNERIYRKAKDSPYKELELRSQKFIQLLFERAQDEYSEIRNFLQQKESAFLTAKKFIEKENVRDFKEKYPDIFAAAYEEFYDGSQQIKLKICAHCGLILRELNDGTLYCVSDRCSLKSKGFTKYKELEVMEKVWVLRLNVARFIYYPGILEQKIKSFLKKNDMRAKLWPNMDEWDFEFKIGRKTWVVDSKDVKDYRKIQKDIIQKEQSELSWDRIIYVVPSDRNKEYIDAVNRVVKDKKKIQCMTLSNFEKVVLEAKYSE